jgi:hypothetical protein
MLENKRETEQLYYDITERVDLYDMGISLNPSAGRLMSYYIHTLHQLEF